MPEDALNICRGLTSGLATLLAFSKLHLVLVGEEASAMQDKSPWSRIFILEQANNTDTRQGTHSFTPTKDWRSKLHNALCSRAQGVIRLSRTSGSSLTRHGHL